MLELSCNYWASVDKFDKEFAEKIEGIYAELQPPVGLKTLEISNYGGINLPAWANTSRYGSLEDVTLSNCRFVEYLPSSLAHLPNLVNLKIEGASNVKIIDDGFHHGVEHIGFPKLESLVIRDMSSLEEWSFNSQAETMPRLRSLHIENCPKLRALPDGMQALTQLQYLYIYDCPKLRALPDGMQALTQLQQLSIFDCPELRALPDGMQALTQLKDLRISDCPKLRALPDGMQALTQLQELRISDCPHLVKRCRGVDRHKIAHIPNVELYDD